MIDDPVTEARLKLVYRDIADRWRKVRLEFFNAHQLQMRVTAGYRSYSDQWALYAQGRKKHEKGGWYLTEPKKIVTDARGGESFHNFGLALDIAFMGDDPYLGNNGDFDLLWKDYGKICETNGLMWGGDFKKFLDRPHCERTYGLSLSQLQMIYEERGLQGVFDKCGQIMACGRGTL